MKDYSEILSDLEREVGDFTTIAGQKCLLAYIATLKLEIDQLRRKENALTRALRQHTGAITTLSAATEYVMPAQLEIDCREALNSEDGFSRLQWGNGSAYRWTGPYNKSAFRVWIDRSCPISLEASLYSWGDSRNYGAITLLVDGQPVALKFGELMFRSSAWPVHQEARFTTVVLHVPHLIHSNHIGEDGDRTLGIAFVRVNMGAY